MPADFGLDGEGDYFDSNKPTGTSVLAPSALLCRNARIDMEFVETFRKREKKQGVDQFDFHQ